MKVLVFDCRKVLEINCRKMYVFACFLQYNADGGYTTGSGSAKGGKALEGSGGQATASIRAMKKAKGIHQGTNGTISKWVTVNTRWVK